MLLSIPMWGWLSGTAILPKWLHGLAVPIMVLLVGAAVVFFVARLVDWRIREASSDAEALGRKGRARILGRHR